MSLPTVSHPPTKPLAHAVIAQQLQEHLREIYAISAYDPTHTYSEMGLDSLDQTELHFSLEQRYKIDIPDAQVGGLTTPAHTAAFIFNALRPTLNFTIPEDSWVPTGDDGRLFAQININGYPFHGEALPVRPDQDEQEGTDVTVDSILGGLREAMGSGSPYQMQMIQGAPYVIIITPHCV